MGKQQGSLTVGGWSGLRFREATEEAGPKGRRPLGLCRRPPESLCGLRTAACLSA